MQYTTAHMHSAEVWALHANNPDGEIASNNPSIPKPEQTGPLDPPIPRPAVVLGPLVNPSRVPEAQEPVAATAFGPLVYPLRVPKAQGSAAESRVSVTNGVPGSVARPQRWADADADGELEMSPEQVQQLLVSVGILPHRQCDRDSFSKVE